uniref:Dolichyl-diphosphooligosaccharide-protein glycosyltransferase subunit OST5 n=1 Tax=Aegilops tauschii subsp. strangulata TaxID=200361 RepID=A0A453NS62_AEGTS
TVGEMQASISSPLPVAWYPALAVLTVAVGLMLTASFFMYVSSQPLPLLFFSPPLRSCLIWVLGCELFSDPVVIGSRVVDQV